MASLPQSGLPVPRGELQRGNYREREEWLESGLFLVDLLHRTMERDDLAGVDVLDVGCGTKVVKTLLDNSSSVHRYVGVDVAGPVIEWLRANVTDPRFEFHHLPARNDLYNPDGAPLSEFDQLPTDRNAFDLICLFSVFTHLAPDDYVEMLRLLRHHVRPEGRLVYSVFLNDPDHPSPFEQAVEANLQSDDPAVVAAAQASLERAMAAKVGGFIDEIPDQPLRRARYDKGFALELVEGTGWDVMAVHPPGLYIQHCVVCRPV
jgi:SAM-dependent methyltransferase